MPYLISVPLIGPLKPDYEELTKSIVEDCGLQFVKIEGEHTSTMTVTTNADSENILRTPRVAQLRKELQRAILAAPAGAAYVTHIGSVVGPVHTGAGDLNISVDADLLLQRLDATLRDGGISDSEKRKTLLEKVMSTLRELAVDFGAKYAAEISKPG